VKAALAGLKRHEPIITAGVVLLLALAVTGAAEPLL
jgi:CHASE1-domain containing sensor protein